MRVASIGLALLASVFACGITQAQVTAVITGPAESAPGDLVILDARSSQGAVDYQWSLTNSTKGYLTFENDSQLVFASGQPGRYTFALAVAGQNGADITVSLATHTVVIGNAPAPEPNPPKPGPEPSPDPEPDPEPEPDPNLTELAKDSWDHVRAITSTADERRQLAANLRSVTGKAAGLGWTPQQMVQELQRLNRSNPINTDDAVRRWTPYFQWVAGAMAGRNDRDSAIEGLNQIADGIEASVPKARVRVSGSFSADDPSNESLRDIVDGLRSSLGHIRREVGD